MGIEVKVAGSAKAQYICDEPGAFFRMMLMAEEDRETMAQLSKDYGCTTIHRTLHGR
jgi:hypothetical protein